MSSQLRAAGYVHSYPADPASIERQRAALLSEASGLGYTLTDADIFVDDGQPGQPSTRPGWASLEAAVLEGKRGAGFACVLVTEPSRVAGGSPARFASVCHRLMRVGVPVLWTQPLSPDGAPL